MTKNTMMEITIKERRGGGGGVNTAPTNIQRNEATDGKDEKKIHTDYTKHEWKCRKGREKVESRS